MRFRSNSRIVQGFRLGAALGLTSLLAIGAYADNAKKGKRAGPTLGTVGNIGGASRQASGVGCPASDCASGTLTQSLDLVTDSANQVACGVAGVSTTENGWARCFDLAADGFAGAVTINSVTFGVAQATIDDINVEVSLYVDPDGSCPPDFATAVLLATASTVVGTADVGNLITLCFPGVEIAAGSTLIVEVENPDDLGDLAIPGQFRSMSNDGGQCGPSYLRAADCNAGVDEWQDLADIGFPDAHLILIIEATTSICGNNPVCGDGSCDCGETCDGCPADCGVCPVCGNGVLEEGEECDLDDAAACPGDCEVDCTCAIRGACCDPGGDVGGCDENKTQTECEGQAGGGNWIGEGSACLLCACAAAEGNPDLDCLVDHGGLGCNDFNCCSMVCQDDPFCCEGEWDFTCVDNATTNCSFPPDNDNCVDSIPIFDGLTDYDTTDASTDGLDVPPGQCDDSGETQVNEDIWFDYVATCTGALLITTCEEEGGSSTYDSDLALYSAGGDDCGAIPCPPSNDLLIACNDDDPLNDCGTVDFHSTIRDVGVTEGDCYKIRVGGWGAGDQGPGTLFIDCQEVVCGDGSCHLLEDCIGCEADCGVCPDPIGACCSTGLGGDCVAQTETGCGKLGGEYLGDDVQCFFGDGEVVVFESNPNVDIPDEDAIGVSDTINIADDSLIGDIDIDLQITHTWTGDLCVTIEHDGTSVQVIKRMGFAGECDATGCCGCAENNMNILLDDDGADPIEFACAPDLAGTFTPENPLSAFNGMSRAGDWTITVSDNAGLDTGTLDGWSLHIEGAASSCDAGCGSCPTDVNDDNNTGPFDLATLLGAWGPTDAGNCLDANGDLNIGPFDLATLLGAWGPCL